MDIAIVGAGKASLVLIELYQADKEINIIGVVDPNSFAPGIKLARKLKIAVYSDLKNLLAVRGVDMIVEVTGNPKVRKCIYDVIDGATDLITAGAAQVMDNTLKRQRALQNSDIASDIQKLAELLSETNSTINKTAVKIESVMREFEMLALNASIEAARAGEMGAGFAVVASRMKTTAKHVQQSVSSIAQSASETTHLLKDMSEIQHKLLDTDRS